MPHNRVHSRLSKSLVNVFLDRDPLAFLYLSAVDRLSLNDFSVNPLNKVQGHHSIDDRFYLHELFLIDLVAA